MSVLLVSNVLGFVLGALGLWATWILGDRSRKGWTISIAIEAGWIAYSLLIDQWAVAATSLAWIALYVRNWRSWKHEDEGVDQAQEQEHPHVEGSGACCAGVLRRSREL